MESTMSAVSRQWATPLTMGVFALLATTGGLMFFHLDSGVQKSVHEWLGWGMVAAVAAHGAANWVGLRRYLAEPGRARVILGVAAALLVLSFVVAPNGGSSAPPPVLALRAVAAAPLKDVAPIAGKSVAQLRADLAAAGVMLPSDEASIGSVVGGDRERLGRAMTAAFQRRVPAS
jgi:hypothetical protein